MTLADLIPSLRTSLPRRLEPGLWPRRPITCPAVALLVVAIGLFLVTYQVDHHVYQHGSVLPSWIRIESADGARQLLSALAAGVITVLGVVFSVTIVALTLAWQQFGPRMLRNFIRDIGTQVTLGSFVATFVYSVLTLGAIGGGNRPARSASSCQLSSRASRPTCPGQSICSSPRPNPARPAPSSPPADQRPN